MKFLDRALAKAKQAGLAEHEEDTEARDAKLQQDVESMWHWLRNQLDEGCDRYQHEAKDDLLRYCLTGRAFEDVIAFLDQMRQNNMVWTYPRERRNEFVLQINKALEDTWVVTEYFTDHSRVERYQNGQLVEILEGDGFEKAVRATIVADEESYYISELTLVADPSAEHWQD